MPNCVKDPGTPAAYPSLISNVKMDLGDADDVEGTAEGVRALRLIMDPTPMPSPAPSSHSVMGVEVPLAAKDRGDDLTAAVQVLILGPVDVEMDGGPTEMALKTSSPEPE